MNAQEMSFDDLVEGTEYDLRVCAVNAAGVSKPSEATGVFKAKDPFDVPGKPGQPEVTEIAAESAALTWAAPDSDGGSPITNYIVEMRRVGDVKWKRATKDTVPETTHTVTGLQKETEYEFRVTAENKAGQGSPSAPSKPAKYGMNQHGIIYLGQALLGQAFLETF